MPNKDAEKQKAIVKKSKAKIYCESMQINLRTDEPEYNQALASASSDAGISRQKYLREAAREKLIRDGYLTPEDK